MKTNKEILNENYSTIKVICYSVAKGSYLVEDLISELCLVMMNKHNAFLNGLIEDGKLDSYIYATANNMFWLSKSTFFSKYKIEHLPLIENTLADESESFEVKEYLLDLGLDANEKLWIETCLEYNFNYSLVHKKTKISRRKIAERIKAIKDKYKK
jgi:hypothetical protein